ncbi:type II toxin-antitoxin system RelE/ParE family toxin [bacterium]|nr:type II toxin-antitoxin system RelE/ParE family toxin [bacterium]
MRVSWHPKVAADLIASASHYERRREGLGMEFLAEAERAVREAVLHPLRWRQVHRQGIRRCRLRKFPHAVYYRPPTGGSGAVRILGVLSGARHPGLSRRRG